VDSVARDVRGAYWSGKKTLLGHDAKNKKKKSQGVRKSVEGRSRNKRRSSPGQLAEIPANWVVLNKRRQRNQEKGERGWSWLNTHAPQS